MNKESIKVFFDNLASSWDKDMIKNEEVIKIILDNANIKSGIDILDVACGTGVLIDDYLNKLMEIVSQLRKYAEELSKQKVVKKILKCLLKRLDHALKSPRMLAK